MTALILAILLVIAQGLGAHTPIPTPNVALSLRAISSSAITTQVIRTGVVEGIPSSLCHGQKGIPSWTLHLPECTHSTYQNVHFATLWVGRLQQPFIAAATMKVSDSKSYQWHTSLATFYAWRQWGYGVPADQKIPGGRSGHFACGGRYLRSTIAVAHRTLPCGTIVRLCHNHVCVNAPVRDRFYGSGFDMTSETCLRIGHCWTGNLKWRVLK